MRLCSPTPRFWLATAHSGQIALRIVGAVVLAYCLAGAAWGQSELPDDNSAWPALELRPFRNWLATHQQRNEAIDTPIQTDRPSFTASQALVPRGWAQLESGYQYTWNDNGRERTNANSGPQLNLRVGLTEWLEFRNLWVGVDSTSVHAMQSGLRGVETTSANFQTGFKLRVSDQQGWIPQSALITTLFLPTGYGAAAPDVVAPMVDYIYCWTIQEKLTLTGSTGAVFSERNGRAHREVYQSVVLGGEWSRTWSTYLEWYITGEDAIYRYTTGQNIDAGILWRPWSNLQLDWRIGHGLSNSADDLFTGVGISGRY